MVTIKRGIPTIDSFTFCLWIKKYNDTQGRLISLLNVDSEPSLSIFIGEKLQIAADGDIWERDVDSTLPRETWKHVCLVFDADESSKVTVFINGAQDGDISTDNLATFVASGRQIVLGDLKRSTDTGFTGEISHFHVWKAALSGTDINTVKNSCLFPSDVEKFKNNLLYKWSVDRTDIDTHESVSKIESDACGSYATPGTLLDSSGTDYSFEMNERDIPTSHGSCHHITTTQIRSEYKFEVKFCLNTPSGSKEYGIYVTFVPVSTDLLLYWPMPFKIAVEIAAVDRDTDSVVKSIPDDLTSPPDDWSAYIGNEQGTLEDRNRRVGWFSIITGSRLKSTAFMRNRKITFIIHIYTEAPGNWYYWDGHYYSSNGSISKKWHEAESSCDNSGAHLASIKYSEENEFVSKRHKRDAQWLGLIGKKKRVGGTTMTKYWWTDDSNSEYRPEGWDSQPEPDLEGPDSALLKTDLMWEKTNCLAEAPYVCKSPGQVKRRVKEELFECGGFLDMQIGMEPFVIDWAKEEPKMGHIVRHIYVYC